MLRIKRVRIAWLLIGVVAFSALAGDDRELLGVQDLLRQDRGHVAVARINGYLERHPGDPRGRFLQARAYERAGKADRAKEIYQQLVHEYPQLPEPFINLAVLHTNAGEYEQARKLLVQALSHHPVYGRAYQNLINLHATMAGIAYKNALALNGEIAKPQLRSAETLLSLSADPANGATVPTGEQGQVISAQSQLADQLASMKAPPRIRDSAPRRSPVGANTVAVTGPQPVAGPKPEAGKVKPPAPDQTVQVAKAKANRAEERRHQGRHLVSLVKRWAEAWSAQDVKRYLGFYSKNFKPDSGLSRRRWEQQRTLRIANKQRIKVKVADIRPLIKGKKATVSFRQSYRSESFGDTVRKTLTLEQGPSGWKIIREVIHG